MDVSRSNHFQWNNKDGCKMQFLQWCKSALNCLIICYAKPGSWLINFRISIDNHVANTVYRLENMKKQQNQKSMAIVTSFDIWRNFRSYLQFAGCDSRGRAAVQWRPLTPTVSVSKCLLARHYILNFPWKHDHPCLSVCVNSFCSWWGGGTSHEWI